MDLFLMKYFVFCVIFTGAEGYLGASIYRRVFIDYVAGIRPQCEATKPSTIVTDFALRQIIDLDEPQQLLYSILWIRLKWSDCRLTWNNTDFDGINNIRVPRNYVWIPDITLYDNSADRLSGMNDYIASVDSNGDMGYNFCSLIRSVCAVDVTYFPFDIQMCNLTFGSWAYGGDEIDFINKSTYIDMTSYVRNSEWEIHNMPVKRSVTYYSGVPYPTLTLNLLLERRPLFYTCNLLFPCGLISSVALLGFLLPPTSGEKVSLQITVLLSLSVFQLIVLELMPPGGSVSFIGLYFIISMVFVGASCFATVIVLNIHYKGAEDRPLPGWAHHCLFRPLSKLMCTRKMAEHEDSLTSHTSIESLVEQPGHAVSVLNANSLERRLSKDIFTISDINLTASHSKNKHDVMGAAEPNGRANGRVGDGNHSNGKHGNLELDNGKLGNSNLGNLGTLLDKITYHTENIYSLTEDVRKAHSGHNAWHILALTLDRLFLCLYMLLLIGLGMVMLLRYIVFGQSLEDWTTDL